MTPSRTQPGTLRSIQYLRGIAALAVVAHHTSWTRTELGAAGVDLFFVISGFIMVHVSRREATPAAFLRARALRVVPLYWLVTLAAVVLHQVTDAPRLLASLAFWPHVAVTGGGNPVLIQGWTLNFEMVFYLIFAAILTMPACVRLSALTLTLAALCAAGAIFTPADPALAEWTSPMLLEFAAGAWLCHAHHRRWLPRGLGAVLLVAVGIMALALQPHSTGYEPWRFVAWGLPMLLVAAGAVGLEAGGGLPRVPGLLPLGNASYALYLTHILVLEGVRPLVRPLPMFLALPSVVLACVLVGWLMHRWVEAPLGTLLRRARPVLAAFTRRPARVIVAQH